MTSALIDNVILCAYTILWLISIIIYKTKVKHITLAYSLIILYAGMTPICLYLYNSEHAHLYFEKDLSFFGFIYLYTMIMLSIKPIINMREENIRGIWIPNDRIVTFYCITFSILSIYGILSIIPKLEEGLVIILSNSEDIVDLYEESKDSRMNVKSFVGNINYLNVMSNLSDFIIPLLLYLYLLVEKRKKIIVFLLFVALLKVPLLGIANASRFQLMLQPFTIALLFFFFKPYMQSSIIKIIKRIFLIGGSFLLLIFLTISISRNISDNKSDLVYGLARYYAQAPIVFNNFCLDANGTREGHFTFPLVIYALGGEAMSENELRWKYSHMKIDNSKFTTFVGDYVLDYGPIVAFIMFVIYSIVMNNILKNNGTLRFSQLIILYLCLRFCCGFYQYQLGSTSGNLFVLLVLFLSLLFRNKKNQIYIQRKSI